MTPDKVMAPPGSPRSAEGGEAQRNARQTLAGGLFEAFVLASQGLASYRDAPGRPHTLVTPD
jgi:hypothetical protein